MGKRYRYKYIYIYLSLRLLGGGILENQLQLPLVWDSFTIQTQYLFRWRYDRLYCHGPWEACVHTFTLMRKEELFNMIHVCSWHMIIDMFTHEPQQQRGAAYQEANIHRWMHILYWCERTNLERIVVCRERPQIRLFDIRTVR